MPKDKYEFEKQLAYAFHKEKPFIAAITNACKASGRQYEATKWETGIIFPMAGEVEIEGHTPAFIACNYGQVNYQNAYEAPGFSCVVKYGEGAFRNQESLRRVHIRATICHDGKSTYFLVRLYSVDGMTHSPGNHIYTFDMRFRNPGLQAWLTKMFEHSVTDLPEVWVPAAVPA